MTGGFEFRLSTYIGEHQDSDVDIAVSFREEPREVTASNALLFGLAVLMLNEMGTIDNLMLDLCKDGVPTEADVMQRIELLMEHIDHDTRN